MPCWQNRALFMSSSAHSQNEAGDLLSVQTVPREDPPSQVCFAHLAGQGTPPVGVSRMTVALNAMHVKKVPRPPGEGRTRVQSTWEGEGLSHQYIQPAETSPLIRRCATPSPGRGRTKVVPNIRFAAANDLTLTHHLHKRPWRIFQDVQLTFPRHSRRDLVA